MELMIALIRSGQTAYDEQLRFLGLEDIPLSPQGREQVEAMAREGAYPPVPLVFTGSASRCHETAALAYPLVPAVVVANLLPFDTGEFEGKTQNEIMLDPRFDAWARAERAEAFPGGDSPHVFQVRAIQGFRSIADEMSNKGIEQAAMVAYSEVISAVMRRFCIPRSAYRDWNPPCGHGYLVAFETVLNTLKLVNEI